MTTFFDTSVLVAAFFEDHEHHDASLRAFGKASKNTGACAAHTLAELYAVTTRMPTRHRLSGDQALRLLENVAGRLVLVSLDAEQYVDAIERAASAGIVGGTIYDALILACAIKARSRTIYTWNVAHFQRTDPRAASNIQTPP